MVLVAGLLPLLVSGARAQSWMDLQVCRHDGDPYREGAMLCIRGLTQRCVNGSWQNLDGERCSDDGAYLNPGQYQFDQSPVIEVPPPLPPPDWRPPVGGPYPLSPDGPAEDAMGSGLR